MKAPMCRWGRGEGGGYPAPWGWWAALTAGSLSAVNNCGAAVNNCRAAGVWDGWKSGEVPAVMPGEGVPGGAADSWVKLHQLGFCYLSHWLTLDPNDDK